MSEATRVERLRVERLPNPLGMDAPSPRLSWRMESDRTNARQTAYRVRAGEWDSGEVESDANLIRYAGPAPGSRTRTEWTVAVRDERGEWSESETAFWETGPDGWTALWIGGSVTGGPRTPAGVPRVATTFRLRKAVANARLYATALGTYVAFVNGERVSDAALSPGWTDYRQRVRYDAYDVTDFVRNGEEIEIAATLGDGWYAGNVEWRGREMYGDRPLFLAELWLTYEDGITGVVETGEGWTVAYGPIPQADLIMGEHHDLRKEAEPVPAEVFEVATTIVHRGSEPVRPTREIPGVLHKKVERWPAPDLIYDLGQNMVGRVRVRLKGERGTTVRLRFAEVLDEKGEIYTANLRTAEQTDYVTLAGDPDGETFEPEHTFHGFRYVEVRGYPKPPEILELIGVVMHSDYEETATFECSDERVNQLFRNTLWGWRGNSVDVPTDCPQRDERLGWTGDAQVFCRTANLLCDAGAFWEKYVQDLADAQSPAGAIPPTAPTTGVVGDDGGPAWADAFLIVPWEAFVSFGDDAVLARHWEGFERYFGFLEANVTDGVRSHPDAKTFHGFGDWLSIEADTPADLIGVAFHARSADLMGRIARRLGRDAAVYDRRFEELKELFRSRYVTPSGRLAPGTQTAYVLGLHFDLLEDREAAVRELVRDVRKRGNRLTTGFVGSPYLAEVLWANGRSDVAFDLLLQTRWPSWLYAVTQGATTIWERWDGWTHDKGFQDAGMNSFNHYAYGAVTQWLVERVAGIAPSEAGPGFRIIEMSPTPGVLTHASASLESPVGRVESAWRVEDGVFRWSVRVPPNAVARCRVPDGGVEERGPGRWEFETAWPG